MVRSGTLLSAFNRRISSARSSWQTLALGQSTRVRVREHQRLQLSHLLPPGVTPKNLLTANPRSRNPALAATMRRLGLAEDAGVGIDRMYVEMARFGHSPPSFASNQYCVTATLLGGAPSTSVTRFVATWPEYWRANPDPLLVMLGLLSQRTVTAAAMAPVLQKPEPEVEVILRQLAGHDGFIERTRGSATHRTGVYRLRGTAVAALGMVVLYRRRVEDDTDRKVVDIVRETGQINGRIVRTLLDVETPTASRILGDLVSREILVKTSDAQRGPSVTYGRGPKFPSRTSRRRPTTTKQETTHDRARPPLDAPPLSSARPCARTPRTRRSAAPRRSRPPTARRGPCRRW